jgi:uncharacterized protein (UPF0264 family)
VAQLLVSVRSASEAVAALAGGAAIIDVKEPLRGALGRAEVSVWREVRTVVPLEIPVSVALGELNEWFALEPGEPPLDLASQGDAGSGITLAKLGFSHAGADWPERWRRVRQRLAETAGWSPGWVAVVYLDWEAARAPDPEAVIQAAVEVPECPGVLFDTWEKSRRIRIRLDTDRGWQRRIARVKESSRFVALAGSLDAQALQRLRPLEPEVFAVRSAACRGGDRLAEIDPNRVARLVDASTGRR